MPLQQITANDILNGTITGSDIASGTITGSNISANTISNTAFQTGSVENYMSAQGSQLGGMRNRIINGAMMIDQRNVGSSVTQSATFAYTVDRFGIVGSVTSKFTAQQSSTAPAGFTNSLLCTSSSAYTVGAAENFNIQQRIEGLNCSDLGWGTASAVSVTLSFWVRSSLTGTFGGSLRNGAADRSYPFTFVINAANTWEQKTVTIAGDTTGTWLVTNGIGLIVTFSLGAGSTLSGTAGSWSANNYSSATGATSVVGTNGATFYITGVQLEKGATATPFENRLYGTELALCQRYYEQWVSSNNYVGGGVGMAYGASGARIQLQYQVPKRAAPSCAASGRIDWADSVGNFTQTAFSFDAPNQNNVLLYGSVTGTTTAGRAMQAYGPLAVPFTVSFSAEL